LAPQAIEPPVQCLFELSHPIRGSGSEVGHVTGHRRRKPAQINDQLARFPPATTSFLCLLDSHAAFTPLFPTEAGCSGFSPSIRRHGNQNRPTWSPTQWASTLVRFHRPSRLTASTACVTQCPKGFDGRRQPFLVLATVQPRRRLMVQGRLASTEYFARGVKLPHVTGFVEGDQELVQQPATLARSGGRWLLITLLFRQGFHGLQFRFIRVFGTIAICRCFH
jgi:hypothetical protein